MNVEEATEVFLRNLEIDNSSLVWDARTFWEGYQAGALTVAKMMAESLVERKRLSSKTKIYRCN